jgi:lipopolysaccharide transport protein LptA
MKINPIYILPILATLATTAYAEDVLEITADSALMHLSTKENIFTGNVRLTRGDDYITADHLVVIQSEQSSIFTATAIESPFVLFGIEGSTGKGISLLYNETLDTLTITGKASLSVEDSILNSEKIVYNITDERVVAGDDNSRVFMKIKQ